MLIKYDILTEEGGRLLTCVKENGRVFLQGKEGRVSIENFISQLFTPKYRNHLGKPTV